MLQYSSKLHRKLLGLKTVRTLDKLYKNTENLEENGVHLKEEKIPNKDKLSDDTWIETLRKYEISREKYMGPKQRLEQGKLDALDRESPEEKAHREEQARKRVARSKEWQRQWRERKKAEKQDIVGENTDTSSNLKKRNRNAFDRDDQQKTLSNSISRLNDAQNQPPTKMPRIV